MTAHDTHLTAQVEAVCAARAILRSELPHSVGTIRQACAVLQTYGDGMDVLQARDMLRAVGPTKPAPVQPPPYSPQVHRIRDILAGALIALSVAYVALVVMLGVPG